MFGDGVGSKVRCKLGSKREEGNTRDQRDLGREWGTGADRRDSKQAVSWAKAGQTPVIAASLHGGFSRSPSQTLSTTNQRSKNTLPRLQEAWGALSRKRTHRKPVFKSTRPSLLQGYKVRILRWGCPGTVRKMGWQAS